MEFIEIDKNNLESEHICCSIADKKGENAVALKKAWLAERLSDGLVFRKLNARGKVFIEYLPAEKAWVPITAPNYMYIDCFWVSGQYKGQGFANKLLEQSIEDAKAKKKDGLVVLSANKKMAFLSDPKYLKYKGFKVADTAAPYFELLYLPFAEKAAVPKFKEQAKSGKSKDCGLILYFSNQCPFAEKYAHILEDIAQKRKVTLQLNKITSLAQAQNAPTPFTTYSLFFNGDFVTNEILSEKKFLSFLEAKGL